VNGNVWDDEPWSAWHLIEDCARQVGRAVRDSTIQYRITGFISGASPIDKHHQPRAESVPPPSLLRPNLRGSHRPDFRQRLHRLASSGYMIDITPKLRVEPALRTDTKKLLKA
jgi:hypothetical protein